MSPVQLATIVIVAALAAVVLYNLYAVLGRRVGRQPGEAGAAPASAGKIEGAPGRAEAAAAGGVTLTGLAALRAKDPSFDADKFLSGAKSAYQTIVRAFASGDRATLQGLVSPQVMAGFEKAMVEREAAGRAESAEFAHPPRADLESGELDGELARAKVRFLAEFTSRAKGVEGETAHERRTAETWTFERDLGSRDPNWTLVRVDAAEA